jgi:hypothetical protein
LCWPGIAPPSARSPRVALSMKDARARISQLGSTCAIRSFASRVDQAPTLVTLSGLREQLTAARGPTLTRQCHHLGRHADLGSGPKSISRRSNSKACWLRIGDESRRSTRARSQPRYTRGANLRRSTAQTTSRRAGFGPIGMEQLWNRVGATGGERSGTQKREDGLGKRQTVASKCHWLPFGSLEREEVDLPKRQVLRTSP